VLADDSFVVQLAMVNVAFGLSSLYHWFYCCYDSLLLLDAVLSYLSFVRCGKSLLGSKGLFCLLCFVARGCWSMNGSCLRIFHTPIR